MRRTQDHVTCSACGRVSVSPPHYCPGCGFDFWRSAPGAPAAAAVRPLEPARGGPSAATMVLAGLAGVVVTVVGLAVFVVVNIETPSRAPLIVDTLPDLDREDRLIDRFFRQVRSPGASFRATTEGTYLETDPPGGPKGRWTAALDISGADWVGHVTFEPDGEPVVEGSLAAIDGQYFERGGDADEWSAFDPREPLGSASPFARISTVNDIQHVGSDTTTDGTITHHLLVTKWMGLPVSEMNSGGGFDEILDHESRLDVWVTDEGVPLRSRWTATLTFREGGVSYSAEMQFSTTFTGWGEIDPLELPGPTTTAGASRIG